MIHDLTYIHHHKTTGKKVYVVMHGAGADGISSPFISSIIEALSEHNASVFGFNFPYCERKEEEPRDPELAEEVDSLSRVITFLHAEGYTYITIVAKSLGGIVASFWLHKHPISDMDAIILGYVVGSVQTKAFTKTPLTVIQGQYDRFGDASKVEEELTVHGIESAKIIEIPNADHSYRNAEKEPIHQREAIERLLKLVHD